MIPDLIKIDILPWQILPAGIHEATIDEVRDRFVNNEKRQMLFAGLEKGISDLLKAGCSQIYLDGSYVTSKSNPNDYDVCWNTEGVIEDLLDPVFFIFDNQRKAQKNKYLGEYFPANTIEGITGKTFLNFFQIEKNTGLQKGILNIKLRG
jgi:hypothetical protein